VSKPIYKSMPPVPVELEGSVMQQTAQAPCQTAHLTAMAYYRFILTKRVGEALIIRNELLLVPLCAPHLESRSGSV
jgi:hypothetical protein